MNIFLYNILKGNIIIYQQMLKSLYTKSLKGVKGEEDVYYFLINIKNRLKLLINEILSQYKN